MKPYRPLQQGWWPISRRHWTMIVSNLILSTRPVVVVTFPGGHILPLEWVVGVYGEPLEL